MAMSNPTAPDTPLTEAELAEIQARVESDEWAHREAPEHVGLTDRAKLFRELSATKTRLAEVEQERDELRDRIRIWAPYAAQRFRELEKLIFGLDERAALATPTQETMP